MADSKWLDPWDFADWTDTDKQPLISHIVNEIKEACDERQALEEFDHSTGFDADNTFSDFIKDLFVFTGGSPNNAVKIANAVWPVDVPETDDFQTSGVVTANSPANLYTLSEILTDEFSYASGTLLHITESDSGTQNALVRFAWFIQWFQVLNYPVYYLRRLKNNATGNQYYNVMEVQEVLVTTIYNYVVSPFSIITATCFVTKRTSGAVPTPVDVYVANDLKETSPPSTPQQVRDYTITTWGNNNSTWWSSTGHDLGDKQNIAELRETNDAENFSGTYSQQVLCEITVKRIRFKTNDDYRVTSPTKYDTPKYWNGYYSGSSLFSDQYPIGSPTGTPPTISAYNDFGTGETNNDCQLNLMVEDGSSYYNIEIASPDFDTEPVMGFPPDPGFNKGASFWQQAFSLQALQLEAGTTLAGSFKSTVGGIPNNGSVSQTDTSIYVKPNTTDGLNFEYYTPAP